MNYCVLSQSVISVSLVYHLVVTVILIAMSYDGNCTIALYKHVSFFVCFKGSACYCTEETMHFTKLADDRCSFPCPGNPVFHCGGKSTISLYDVTTPALCTDCTVGIYSEPLNTLFKEQKIFTNSTGSAVVEIDVSLNGVHIVNVTTGENVVVFPR